MKTLVPRRLWVKGLGVEQVERAAWAIQQKVVDFPVAVGGYYDELGTLYRDFGRPEVARIWFDKAIENWRRGRAGLDHAGPSIRVALTLWKADRTAELKHECGLLVLEHAAWANRSLVGLGEQEVRRVQIAREATASANVLLGRYEEAVAAAEGLHGFDKEPDTRKDSYGVLLLSRGARDRDHLTFEKGLDVLSDQVDRWPTPLCSIRVDLFRFGLSLPFCNPETYIRGRMGTR